MFANQALDRIAAEPFSAIADEHRLGVDRPALLEPGAQGLHAIGPQWRRTFLASFADASDMCSGPESHIAAGQLDQLRDPQARL